MIYAPRSPSPQFNAQEGQDEEAQCEETQGPAAPTIEHDVSDLRRPRSRRRSSAISPTGRAVQDENVLPQERPLAPLHEISEPQQQQPRRQSLVGALWDREGRPRVPANLPPRRSLEAAQDENARGRSPERRPVAGPSKGDGWQSRMFGSG